LVGVDKVYYEISQRYSSVNPEQLKNIFKSVSNSYYSHIECKYVIDKWRGWIANVDQIKQIITPTPKIICTYRPVEEIITSFIFLLEKDPNNFIDKKLKENNLIVNNTNRSLYLWNYGVVGECYEFFKQIKNDKTILYISYDSIVNNTYDTLDKIYEYLNISSYKHCLQNLSNDNNDNDAYWEIKGLHSIRKNISLDYKNPHDYMDTSLINYFKQFNSIYNGI
jgi:hypothetical protein